MALEHRYTAICEYARLEFGGKWTIIGLFPNGIGTPQIPLSLPMLTFFQVFHAEAPGSYTLTCKLTQLDTGVKVVEAKMQLVVGQVGPTCIPVPCPNLQFRAYGTYTWEARIDGHDDIAITQFQVAHVPPPMVKFGQGLVH